MITRFNPLRVQVLIVLVITVFLSFSTFGQAVSNKDRKAAKKLSDQAKKAFQQRNYRTAVDKYKESLTLNPVSPEAHYNKGYSHYALKENDLALTELDAALAQGYKPELDIYRIRWGLYNEKKDYDAALGDITKLLAAEPTNAEALIALGDISYSKGAYREAIDAYQKASARSGNADLFYWIAKSYANLNDPAGQATAASQAIAKGTQHRGDALRLLGDAYQKQNKPAEAVDAYKKALDADPSVRDVYLKTANLFRSQGKFTDAVEVLNRGRRTFPNDGSFYTELSWYYSILDRSEDAVQSGLAGTQLSPENYLGYTNLCRAYNDVNKPAQAVVACNTALRLNPNDGETLFYLGRAHDLAGRADEATTYYRRAVTGLEQAVGSNPDSADTLYLLGNAYFADKQREKAVETYSKALQLNPGFARARYNMGVIFARQKNKNGAIEQYNQLLTLDPNLAAKLKAEIDKL